MKYNLYFHCSENTAFYIFTAVKYSFFKICIILNTYFPVFHYFVYNKSRSGEREILSPYLNNVDFKRDDVDSHC